MAYETLRYRLEWPGLVWTRRWFCLVCGGEPDRVRRLKFRHIKESRCPEGYLEFDAPLCGRHSREARSQARLPYSAFFLAAASIVLAFYWGKLPWVLYPTGALFFVVGFTLMRRAERGTFPFEVRVENSGEVALDYPSGAPRPPEFSAPAPVPAPSTAAGPAIERPDRRNEEPDSEDEEGDDKDTPDLEGLLQALAKGKAATVSQLSDLICHQNTVSSETPLAIKPLAKLVQDPSFSNRREALWLLGTCARAAQEESGSPSGKATLEALGRELSALARLLEDPDREIRQAAALTLGAGKLATGSVREQIRRLQEREKDPRVRASLLLALFPLEFRELVWMRGTFERASDADILLVAAALIAAAQPGEVPAGVRNHLQTAFRQRDTVMDTWSRIDPGGISPLDLDQVLDSNWSPD